MQVVLLEDVKALGKKGQIVNVNDGYARNFILPKKLGVEANSKNLNDLKLKKANDDRIAAEQLAALSTDERTGLPQPFGCGALTDKQYIHKHLRLPTAASHIPW